MPLIENRHGRGGTETCGRPPAGAGPGRAVQRVRADAGRSPTRSSGPRRGSGRSRQDRSLSPTSSCTTGDHGGDVVATRGDGDLGHGLRERVAGDRPGLLADLGSVGYSSTGIDSSVKCAAPQVTEIFDSSVVKVTWGVRQAARDVVQQPTGDQDRAGVLDVRRDRRLRRDLVVERRQREPVALGVDQDTGQDREVVRCGRSFTAKETASEKTSRLTSNFTAGTPVDRCGLSGRPIVAQRSRARIFLSSRRPQGWPAELHR